MGFGPSGPRVLSAPPEPEGAGQFAEGLGQILAAAKQERDYSKGIEEFNSMLEKQKKNGDVNRSQLAIDVLANKNIPTKQKDVILKNLQEQEKVEIEKDKAKAKAAEDSEKRIKQLENEYSLREGQSIINRMNAGDITPEEAASLAFGLPDKEVRNNLLSETGRRTDRATRIEQAKASERVKQEIKDYSNIQEKVESAAESAQESLNAVAIGRAGIKKAGPTSRANAAKFLQDFDNKFLKLVGRMLETPEGQAINQAQQQELKANLRSTYGARPAVVEFETQLQSLIKVGAPEKVNKFILDLQEHKATTDLQLKKAFDVINNERLQGLINESEAIIKWNETRELIQNARAQQLNNLLGAI